MSRDVRDTYEKFYPEFSLKEVLGADNLSTCEIRAIETRASDILKTSDADKEKPDSIEGIRTSTWKYTISLIGERR